MTGHLCEHVCCCSSGFLQNCLVYDYTSETQASLCCASVTRKPFGLTRKECKQGKKEGAKAIISASNILGSVLFSGILLHDHNSSQFFWPFYYHQSSITRRILRSTWTSRKGGWTVILCPLFLADILGKFYT